MYKINSFHLCFSINHKFMLVSVMLDCEGETAYFKEITVSNILFKCIFYLVVVVVVVLLLLHLLACLLFLTLCLFLEL